MWPAVWQIAIVLVLLFLLFGRGVIRDFFRSSSSPADDRFERNADRRGRPEAIRPFELSLSDRSPKRYRFLGLRLTRVGWIVAGMIAGGVLFAPLGGIGIATLGTAIGIGWWVLGAVLGAALVRWQIDRRD